MYRITTISSFHPKPSLKNVMLSLTPIQFEVELECPDNLMKDFWPRLNFDLYEFITKPFMDKDVEEEDLAHDVLAKTIFDMLETKLRGKGVRLVSISIGEFTKIKYMKGDK